MADSAALITQENGGHAEGRSEDVLPKKLTYVETMELELDEELTKQSKIKLNATGAYVWGTETDLDENAYGAAAVAIVRDITKLRTEIQEKLPCWSIALTAVRLSFSLGIMMVNLVFQCLILWYIWIFVCKPNVRHVQELYADFHATNFDSDGKLLEDAWASYPKKGDVCQITMSSREFYYGILLLWGLQMMDELRSCQRVFMDIWAIKRVDSPRQMLEYVTTGDYELGGRCLIIGLTPGTRFLVIFFVCLPRAIIGFLLFFLGCQWLSSSASFGDMTLNAMALSFVKNIDEILYDSVLPRALKDQIADTNVFKIEKRKTKRDVDNSEWQGYRRTTIWVAAMILTLGLYGQAFQTVLPCDLSQLKVLCGQQIEESQTPICYHSTFMGWSEECYPYGEPHP